MTKTIAVHGATGTQGGSVVRSLLKSEWKVRAITRNASGASAKSLVDAGVEVVTANLDDESSLIKAYEVKRPRPPNDMNKCILMCVLIGCRSYFLSYKFLGAYV